MLEQETKSHDTDEYGRCTNKYTLKGLQAAFKSQWPILEHTSTGTLHYTGGAKECPHCKRTGHLPDACYRHPDAICEVCGERGHRKQVCPQRRQGKGGKGDKTGKGDKAGKGNSTRGQRKRAKDKAMKDYGKAMAMQHYAAAAVMNMGSAAPPAAPTPPTPPAAPPIFPAAPQSAPAPSPASGIFVIEGASYYRRVDGTLAPVPSVQPPRVQVRGPQNFFVSAIAERISAPVLPCPDMPDTASAKCISDPQIFHALGANLCQLNAGQGGSVTGRGLRLAKSGVVLCIDNWRDKSSYRAPVPECEVTSHYSHTRCAIGAR